MGQNVGNMGQDLKITYTEYGGKKIEVAWEKIQGQHGTKIHRWHGTKDNFEQNIQVAWDKIYCTVVVAWEK